MIPLKKQDFRKAKKLLFWNLTSWYNGVIRVKEDEDTLKPVLKDLWFRNYGFDLFGR
jgi:hypothetical protein